MGFTVRIGSALRRGMLNEQEAKNNQQTHFTIRWPFTLSGLGELVKNINENHRIIHFGR
jgi:tRNA 2-thiouridine synthesizing protein D